MQSNKMLKIEMPDTALYSLIYVSSAVRLLDFKEIEYLLKRARERNVVYEVSGALLYNSGNFMQYLEGPKKSLDIVYKIIEEDKQHTGIILLWQEGIENRQFGDWSMAFEANDTWGYVGSASEKRSIKMMLTSLGENPSTARIVLRSFWDRLSS